MVTATNLGRESRAIDRITSLYLGGARFKQAAEDPDLRKQMDAKGTEVNWVGPDPYRTWADKAFADHEKVAIKIGLWKK